VLSGNPEKKNVSSVVSMTYQVDKDHRLYGLVEHSTTDNIDWGHSILRNFLCSFFIKH